MFAGGVLFRTPFGDIYSNNITSDRITGIGSWSFADFYQAMKRGIRPDGTHLYPVFPYTSFSELTDSDIASIFLYIKTIQPVDARDKANKLKFPYNMRFALRAWNRLFFVPATFVSKAGHSDEWNRGAYLVQGLGHCGACHTPRNFLGAERGSLTLSGGVLFDQVRRGKFRQWSAVNLTSAGLATWTIQDIVDYLKRGQNAHAIVQGPMIAVVMNSTRYLLDADARAIAVYIKSLPAKNQPERQIPSHEELEAGSVTYTVYCGTCHLPTGLGDQTLGVALDGDPIIKAAEPSSLINVILYGPHLPPPPFVVDRTRMKSFGKRLSSTEVADLATYLRARFGNNAGIVGAPSVEEQR